MSGTHHAGPVPGAAEPITERHLADLPEPVARYLRYTGVLGRTIPRRVRLTQRGRIRQDAEHPWMPLTAVEHYTTAPPGFDWYAWARLGALPLVRVHDSYRAGRGGIDVALLGLLPLARTRGPEMDHGALLRYLNEMMWFPQACLLPNILWEQHGADSAVATLSDGAARVAATLDFDAQGRLENFTARRFRDLGGGKMQLTTWATPIKAYGELAGLRLPVRGSGVWRLADGDLTYVELDILAVAYFD